MEINPELTATESEKKDAESDVENDDFTAGSKEHEEDFTALLEEDSDYNLELWHALVGDRPSLPEKGDLVVYFPQGHLEYAALITSSSSSSSEASTFNLQPEIICRVQHVQLIANKVTDEACAHVTLLPEESVDVTLLPEQEVEGQNPKGKEVILQSGVNEAKKAALREVSVTLSTIQDLEAILIPAVAFGVVSGLDYKPFFIWNVHAEDVQGTEWRFNIKYNDSLQKCQILKGWTEFVRRKRLCLKDTVVFFRCGNGKLRLGIKRFGCECGLPMSILAKYFQCSNVLSPVADAILNKSPFNVFYCTRVGRADFIIPYQKYINSITRLGMIGDRIQTADYPWPRCSGVVTGILEFDRFRWPNSKWKCLMVRWDYAANEEPIEEAVSPWEIVLKVRSSSDLIIDVSLSPKLKKQRTVRQFKTSLHDPAEKLKEREKQFGVMVRKVDFLRKEFPKRIIDKSVTVGMPTQINKRLIRRIIDKSATVGMPTHLKISKRPDQEISLDPMVHNSLQYLEFDSCFFHSPTLVRYFPSTLKTFKMTNCINSEHVLALLMDQKDSSLEFLEIDGCSSLVFLPIHKLPTTIRQIKISNCRNLKSLGESLANEKHDSAGSDPATDSIMMSQLRALLISDCEELDSPEGLHSLIHLELLAISNCSSLVTFPEGGLPKNSLRSFQIHKCENLKSLPRQLHEVTSLENLDVRNCHCLVSFPEGGLPPNLVSLRVVDCQNLNSPSRWGLHKLKHLRNYALIDGRRNRTN